MPSLSQEHTSATFQLIAQDLDPDAITAALGITPSRTWQNQSMSISPPTAEGPQPEAVRCSAWFLSSAESVDSDDLAVHISWLLDRLESVQERLPPFQHAERGLVAVAEGEIYAGIACYWLGSEGGAIVLDPALMQRLSSMNLRLGIGVHWDAMKARMMSWPAYGTAMSLTINDRKSLMVDPFAYVETDPQRGDIILYSMVVIGRARSTQFGRVIGLPGEVVSQHDGSTYIDGILLDEPYLGSRSLVPFGPDRVPEDHYFVLGDHRMTSFDSTKWPARWLPRRAILGKAILPEDR